MIQIKAAWEAAGEAIRIWATVWEAMPSLRFWHPVASPSPASHKMQRNSNGRKCTHTLLPFKFQKINSSITKPVELGYSCYKPSNKQNVLTLRQISWHSEGILKPAEIWPSSSSFPHLYSSYDKLVYFCLPIAELDYYDLCPTPPLFKHNDLMAGEEGNGVVGERFKSKQKDSDFIAFLRNILASPPRGT